MSPEINITEEQWDKVVKVWNSSSKDNPPSLKELIKICFDRDDIDGRSFEGIALRKKLAEAKLKPRVEGEYKKKEYIQLTDEHKEFVKNNYGTMSSLEMARVIFNNKNLTNLNHETKSILYFLKENGLLQKKEDKDIPDKEWKPPRTEDRVIQIINCYKTKDPIDPNKLSGKQKKDVKALLGYLNTYRFIHQINTYEKERDRNLFESEFVRCCFDKNDLTEEEVDQYILYSNEVVIGTSIFSRTEKLSTLLDEISEDEDKKITMSLVEAINSIRTEYNQCIIRQNKLLSILKIERSKREGAERDSASTILNLINAWKEEETRKRMIELAKQKKDKLKEGINELATMDDLKAKILGLTENEALNG
ncbi:MAG: hypothetical protein AABY22_03945 [Nanoarchaeota archaeon]